MNKQFDLGPWVVEPAEDRFSDVQYYIVNEDKNEAVAGILVDYDFDKEEAEANARLIAAAPAMFELLEKFCDQCNKHNIEALTPEYEQAMTILTKITTP